MAGLGLPGGRDGQSAQFCPEGQHKEVCKFHSQRLPLRAPKGHPWCCGPPPCSSPHWGPLLPHLWVKGSVLPLCWEREAARPMQMGKLRLGVRGVAASTQPGRLLTPSHPGSAGAEPEAARAPLPALPPQPVGKDGRRGLQSGGRPCAAGQLGLAALSGWRVRGQQSGGPPRPGS